MDDYWRLGYPPPSTQTQFSDVEVSAEMRTAARVMRDMFVSLRQEGFTESQAIAIIGQAIAASVGAQ